MIVPSSIHHNGFGSLSRTAQVTYYYLATYANVEGVCWPGQERIIEETGITHKPLVRALKELEAAGWIFRWISHGRGRSTRYQIYTKGGHKAPLLGLAIDPVVSKKRQEKGVTGTPPSSNEQTIQTPTYNEEPLPAVDLSEVPTRRKDSWSYLCATE